jgi:hypothetical protein
MTEFTCEFCKKAIVPESHMICDKCAEKEIAAQDMDEKIADYYNEQHRLRYKDIHLFDNDMGRISVTYRRKVLCAWDYSGEDSNFFGTGRRDVMLTAKGYMEGWLDAVAAKQKM